MLFHACMKKHDLHMVQNTWNNREIRYGENTTKGYGED